MQKAALLGLLLCFTHLSANSTEPVTRDTASTHIGQPLELTAPTEFLSAELSARSRGHFNKTANRSGIDLLHDAEASGEFVDLKWQLQQAINRGTPPTDLEDIGVTARSDGAVEIDLKKAPQWSPLQEKLRILEQPGMLDFLESSLRERGFQDKDFTALKQYFIEHPSKQVVTVANRPLVNQFVATIRSSQGATLQQGRGFNYQRDRNAFNARRQWALGLMDNLDPQAQRILASTLEEVSAAGGMVIGPDKNADEALALQMKLVRSPQGFEDLLKLQGE